MVNTYDGMSIFLDWLGMFTLSVALVTSQCLLRAIPGKNLLSSNVFSYCIVLFLEARAQTRH